MRYMLLIYSPEAAWTADEWKGCVTTSQGICEELIAKGQFRAASPLHPVATGTTVRVRDSQQLVTSGPFAETTEQLGGFYVIDVPDLDQAIAIAARLPAAKKGTVEIRPIFKLEGLPAEKFELLQHHPAGLTPYLLLCYDDEQGWERAGEAAMSKAMQEALGNVQGLAERQRYLSASPLHPSSTATSVRIRQDRRQITDGPFAETHEALGGYYVILAENQAEAVAIAARHPGARLGSVEVRALFDVSTLSTTPC